MLKTRQSHDHLIFNLGIPIPGKDGLYWYWYGAQVSVAWVSNHISQIISGWKLIINALATCFLHTIHFINFQVVYCEYFGKKLTVLTHWPLGDLNEILYMIFKLILVTNGWRIFCENAHKWMSLDFTDVKSTLVQVMAWCHKAPSHYMSQCWPRSLSPYGVTRPQWVNGISGYKRW